ncbi:MAG: hypothetical protein M1830_002359 [Pleopsidium flavum]|nr:MAG: hypothetical protein M1830_002359 [Pleopsidium flavum]
MSSLSLVTIPVLLQTSTPTSLLLQQWKSIYLRGHIQGPAIATLTGLTYAYVAYAKSQQGKDGTGYGIAGLATVAIVPYTLTIMGSVNRRLMEAAAAGPRTAVGSEEVKVLVARWSRLNAVRGLFPLLGGIVGLWSVLT